MTNFDWHDISGCLGCSLDYNLIDKAEVENDKAIGHKAVSSMDWYFKYHFPGCLMMPGSFLMEMMKQTALLLVTELSRCKMIFECKSFRIFRAVRPGDMLETVVSQRPNPSGGGVLL